MEKLKYQMSSRATILLGRESVSRVDGAIIELVKNTYDADARFCYICFDIACDTIYILDNGVGMTKSIIESCWMMIGTDNKQLNHLSQKKRIKSGEKGIGRFALDRLGNQCVMHTKHASEPLIYWFNDWRNFEQTGKTINDIEADFAYLESSFESIIPTHMRDAIEKLRTADAPDIDELKQDVLSLETGTLFEIRGLRDKWTSKEIEKIVTVLGFLVPPVEQKEYSIFFQKEVGSLCEEIENDITEEYDYKVRAHFDGVRIAVTVYRNEFDLNIMPKELFKSEAFSEFPYRLEDFNAPFLSMDFSISELTGNTNPDFLATASSLGEFDFNYVFMKLTSRDDGPYFYKSINPKRRLWLSENGGIKIYRDNFVVRPYGDPQSNSHDWLGLDARKGVNPVAISHKSGQWHVNNSQMQGTVLISRVLNNKISDKSSREGIIENEHFSVLTTLIKDIVAIFEQDRAYIVRNIKAYLGEKSDNERTKEEAREISKDILNKKRRKVQSEERSDDKTSKLAQAVQIYEEEREELITEIKLLRALATNGLMTTTMVHDLKTINALLVSRVRGFRVAVEENDKELLERNLNDLKINDEFLKSWITVITTQSNKDRRKRLKKDLYQVIKESVKILEPILSRKKVYVKIEDDSRAAKRKIFASDFDSIIYNLIINSIESFEETPCENRLITINLETQDEFILNYLDNGHGLTEAYVSNPYSIFEYGVTSKYDALGNQVGTGLGMYIVASSINEYNGGYTITRTQGGFGLRITIPLENEVQK